VSRSCVRCGDRPAPLRFLDTNIYRPDDLEGIRNYFFLCGEGFLPEGTIAHMRELWSSGEMDDDGLVPRPVKN
jgi:hypothetical protein